MPIHNIVVNIRYEEFEVWSDLAQKTLTKNRLDFGDQKSRWLTFFFASDTDNFRNFLPLSLAWIADPWSWFSSRLLIFYSTAHVGLCLSVYGPWRNAVLRVSFIDGEVKLIN